MTSTMSEEIQRLIAERPELARWFDPLTGKYTVKKVKVRSQRAQKRAISRLSNGSNGESGVIGSMHEFERVDVAQKDQAMAEVLASRGQIIDGGLLHTQRRLGKCKGGRDSRVLHDAIKTSVQQIRAMRTEVHNSQALHSVSLIAKDEHETARAIDELNEKTLAMDTSIWQEQTLIDVKKECKFRKNLLNKLINNRRSIEIDNKKVQIKADQRVSEAAVMEHNANGGLHAVNVHLNHLKKELKRARAKAEHVAAYSKVLAHMQKRTSHDMINAPVRQNFLNETTHAYGDEIRQATGMLESSIHQADAEKKERDSLIEHIKELEHSQQLKLTDLDDILKSERNKIKQLKKKEQERKRFALELIDMNDSDRKKNMHSLLINNKNKSLNRKRNTLISLEEQNMELINAFELMASTIDDNDSKEDREKQGVVNFLQHQTTGGGALAKLTGGGNTAAGGILRRYLNRGNKLTKMISDHERLTEIFKQKKNEQTQLKHSLYCEKLNFDELKKNNINSTTSRKKMEALGNELMPILRNSSVKYNELNHRIEQLKSIVTTCNRIVNACKTEEQKKRNKKTKKKHCRN